jgi:hypothetical protein
MANCESDCNLYGKQQDRRTIINEAKGFVPILFAKMCKQNNHSKMFNANIPI